jgi:hypothetical protein
MAVTHGEVPKFIYVPSYSRWVRGELRHVDSYLRGWTPPLYFRDSDDQLDFGF